MSVRVSLSGHRDSSYDILIGRGLLAQLPALLQQRCHAAAYAVISDSHVGPLYGARLAQALTAAGRQAHLLTFLAGEGSKNRESWAALSDRMVALQLGRDTAVVAVGGGVTGDLAGFIAATYLRGIPYVHVPTSLLAMIDSSIGGKTGIDVPDGKNLIGAFHQPRVVVSDLDVLGSLPREQLITGMAEAVKHGVIADAEYFALLEAERAAVERKDPAMLERVVARSVEIKATVVAQDEREVGVRAVLNFGHTVGHAIEAVAAYGIAHGAAVAMGMVVEAQLAEALGLAVAGTRRRIAAVLGAYGLPVTLPANTTTDDLLATMRHDKKARGGEIRFALPARIGAMYCDAGGAWTVPVAEAVLREALSGGR